MKERTIIEHVEELGYELKPGRCIVVKRAPETIPLALIEFATQDLHWQTLCVCERELVIFELTMFFKRGSLRVIDFDDIRATSVETADGGMSRRITITLGDEEIVLNAQREETSAWRTSGVYGSWHAANLPAVVKLIEQLGSPARGASANAESEC